MKTTELTKEQIWDTLIDLSIATKDELILVTNINGYNTETLNDIIYVRTGYRCISQLLSEDE